LTKQLDKKNITQVVDGHSASENGMPPNRAHMHGSERVTGYPELITEDVITSELPTQDISLSQFP
jgi:hypothetical protein